MQAGIVVHAGNDPAWPGRGLYVVIRGADRLLSYQMHMARVDVAAGDIVQPRQSAGLSGSSGWSTGPHLHLGCQDQAEAGNGHQGFIDPAGLLL